ncbi:MAG TPA: tetratricopeptide repeat protein, partial [Casimicrobiaceae bacterium]|nr:tetratricopeptide repeat protein [Casimicrobiaceae bacterium]
GVMCEKGQGGPQDHGEARRWFRAAADQGNVGAQFGLGVLFDHGYGVDRDYAEAAKWFRQAAEEGNAAAQLNLGIMYFYGRGVPQDYLEAHKWLNLAAARFLPSEAEKRARAVKNRDIVARKMTPQRIEDAQDLARAWRPRHPARALETGLTVPAMHPATSGRSTPLLHGIASSR